MSYRANKALTVHSSIAAEHPVKLDREKCRGFHFAPWCGWLTGVSTLQRNVPLGLPARE